MQTKTIKKFLDQINDMIEEHGEDCPVTLGMLRDITEENLIRKELKEAEESFFATQSDVDLAAAHMTQNRLQKWLESKFMVQGSLPEVKKEFEKTFPNAGTNVTPVAFLEAFPGIY